MLEFDDLILETIFINCGKDVFILFKTCKRFNSLRSNIIKLQTLVSNDSLCTEYTLFGKLHREGAPAVVWTCGTKEWWDRGKPHRKDGPAMEWVSGTKEWWFKGRKHRKSGPAVIKSNGSKEWWVRGRRWMVSD